MVGITWITLSRRHDGRLGGPEKGTLSRVLLLDGTFMSLCIVFNNTSPDTNEGILRDHILYVSCASLTEEVVLQLVDSGDRAGAEDESDRLLVYRREVTLCGKADRTDCRGILDGQLRDIGRSVADDFVCNDLAGLRRGVMRNVSQERGQV